MREELTNLLVDLFSSEHLRKQVNRRISYIKNTDYSLSSNTSKTDLLNYCLEFTDYDNEFTRTIEYSLENPRNCFNVLGTEIDTHFSLETLNVSTRSRDFIAVYSIKNLLPLVLNILCGVDPLLFKDSKAIDDLSESILEIEFSGNCNLSTIMGIDSKLDSYLAKYLANTDDEVTALSAIVYEINSVAMEVLKYIVCHLESYSPLVVLATDRSKIVLSSNLSEVEQIELVFNGYKYILNPFVTNETFGYYKYNAEHKYLLDYVQTNEEDVVI